MEMNDTPQDKYLTALAKYDTQLNDADVQVQVAALIEKKVPENNTEEVKKFLFNCIAPAEQPVTGNTSHTKKNKSFVFISAIFKLFL